MQDIIKGKAFVLGDDIDTDQIIPARHLVYSLSDPQERRLYGKYALSGVPAERSGLPQGNTPFVPEEGDTSPYTVIIGGKNFGCGSSREHAPFALREAGARVVVAEFYARIFFRNCVNGGYLIPYETPIHLMDKIKTGQEVEIDLKANTIKNITTGEVFELSPLGDILPILKAGDVFAYAKSEKMM